jgi:hypothetical protein
MAINVRLEKELERALVALAHREGVTKSDLLRQCLREFLARRLRSGTPWELGKDLFGKVGSGRSDLSRRRKAIVGEKILAKKNRRRLGPARRPLRQG